MKSSFGTTIQRPSKVSRISRTRGRFDDRASLAPVQFNVVPNRRLPFDQEDHAGDRSSPRSFAARTRGPHQSPHPSTASEPKIGTPMMFINSKEGEAEDREAPPPLASKLPRWRAAFPLAVQDVGDGLMSFDQRPSQNSRLPAITPRTMARTLKLIFPIETPVSASPTITGSKMPSA